MMKKRKWPVYLLLVLCAVVTVGPFLWMILTSFKSYEESIQIPPTIFPEVFTMGSYQEVVDKFPFLNFYVNTFLVLLFTIGIELLICSMAAYAFARLHFPGRDVIFIVLLALLMVPGQIFLVPNYDIMVKLHLADTVTALWLPIYYRILLPLLKPALSSLAILTAISTFKDLMWPLIVNNSMDKMTLSAGLAMLIGEHTTYYPQVMAGGIIAILPMIIIFFLFQKQFVEGIATTGVKQ